MMPRPTILAHIVACAAAGAFCGGSPSAPTTTTTPPPPPPITLTGHVTATNGGQALPGLTATIGAATSSTDAGGIFTASPVTPAAAAVLALTGPSILARTVRVSITASRDLPVDAIALSGSFDATVFRQLVRGAYDFTDLQPLRRWTHNPQIYLRTVDEVGRAIDARTLDSTERTLLETVPLWTDGQLAATVTRGTESRAGAAGWITVVWPGAATDIGTPQKPLCGLADVGREGGQIWLNYRQGGSCRCDGVADIRPRTVRHELGHAMGFWHTDSTADLMSGPATLGCDAFPTARERYHAAIAYRRPVGNVDPDADPASAVNLQPLRIQ